MINIVKSGNPEARKKGEFHFICKKCGCEWYAGRGKDEAKISPPCVEFYAYMNCPNCGKFTADR